MEPEYANIPIYAEAVKIVLEGQEILIRCLLQVLVAKDAQIHRWTLSHGFPRVPFSRDGPMSEQDFRAQKACIETLSQTSDKFKATHVIFYLAGPGANPDIFGPFANLRVGDPSRGLTEYDITDRNIELFRQLHNVWPCQWCGTDLFPPKQRLYLSGIFCDKCSKVTCLECKSTVNPDGLVEYPSGSGNWACRACVRQSQFFTRCVVCSRKIRREMANGEEAWKCTRCCCL